MTRYLLTGAAALALMTGTAMAQFASSTTTTTTQSVAPTVVPLPPLSAPVPSAGTITSSQNERSVNQNGVVVEKSQSYKNDGLNSSSTSHVETRAPDGSQMTTTRKEWSTAPTSVTTTTRSSTVTTTDDE